MIDEINEEIETNISIQLDKLLSADKEIAKRVMLKKLTQLGLVRECFVRHRFISRAYELHGETYIERMKANIGQEFGHFLVGQGLIEIPTDFTEEQLSEPHFETVSRLAVLVPQPEEEGE